MIATSKSDDKLDRARELGAWETINYVTDARLGGARNRAHGRATASTTWSRWAAPARRTSRSRRRDAGGTVSLIGVLTGSEARINPHPVALKGLRVQGIIVGSRAMFEDMNRAIAASGLKPVIDRVFPFDQAPEALRHLQAAGHVGKVVISV